MWNPDDIKSLTPEQVKLLIPRRRTKKYEGIDSVTIKLLQNSTDCVVIPSHYVVDSTRVSTFSCGHVMLPDELELSTKNLCEFCKENGLDEIAKFSETQYALPLIHAQCPRCLQRNLQRKVGEQK